MAIAIIIGNLVDLKYVAPHLKAEAMTKGP